MSKEEKNKVLPDLRFAEFKGDGNWEVKTIDECCEVLNNRRKPVTENNRVKGKYPYYGASGIVDYVDDFIFDERLVLVGEDGAKWRAFERTAFIVDGKYWVNNHAHVLRATGINDTLLENYLVMLDISKFITGAAPPKLTLGKLKEIPVPIPISIKEQQKIADSLSSLDDLITAENEKLAALKAQKKGLMQKLFAAEGETVPKMRFAEFRDSGEWEVKTLEELTDKIGDGIHTTPIYDESGKYYFINGNNLIDGEIYVDEKTKRVSEEEYKKYKKDLNGRTILLSINGTIGNVALYANEAVILGKSACYINTSIELEKIFLYYLLQSDELKNYFESELTGTTIRNLSLNSIRKASISFPSKTEQQKIASCLSSLDESITAQTEKIKALTQHKKGLMQGLFPKTTN